MHSKKVLNKTLYHLFVVLFGFVMVYPVLWMVSGSFKGNAEILRGTLALIPNELKLDNYATGWKGFGGTTFATFFTNSIFITVIATFGTVISSSLVAYALSRVRFRGRKFWFTCMLVTMMLPTQVIMIPQYLIYYRLGLVPGYVPLILPYFCGQAFFIYQMMQFVQGIPKDLDEAATIDGCNRVHALLRILLPVAAPGIVTALIFVIINAWNEYTVALTLISTDTFKPLTVGINIFNGYNMIEWQYLFAASLYAIVPVVILFVGIEKNLVGGLTSGGVKG